MIKLCALAISRAKKPDAWSSWAIVSDFDTQYGFNAIIQSPRVSSPWWRQAERGHPPKRPAEMP